jgi:hypothetical protein
VQFSLGTLYVIWRTHSLYQYHFPGVPHMVWLHPIYYCSILFSGAAFVPLLPLTSTGSRRTTTTSWSCVPARTTRSTTIPPSLVMSGTSSKASSSASNQIHPLSQVYQNISNQTCQLAASFIEKMENNKEEACSAYWPQAESFTRHLDVKNSDSDNSGSSSVATSTTCSSGLKYSAPAFPDGDGPVGVFALCPRNPPQTSRLIDHCMQHGWEPFCRDLQQIFRDDNNDDDDDDNSKNNVMQAYLYPSPLMHMALAIFQEHPRILDEAGKKQWQHIDDERMEILIQRLDEFVYNGNFPDSIPLALDAIVLTPDGAMIAGFVEEKRKATDGDDKDDDDNDAGHFARLRSGLLETAKDVLGTLSSRPKNLIHVSLGRILGLPPPASTATGAPTSSTQRFDGARYDERVLQVQQLVCHYNQQVFPRVLQDLKESGSGGDESTRPTCSSGVAFPLQDFSLVRNSVWLCEENVFYNSWQLDSLSSSSSS